MPPPRYTLTPAAVPPAQPSDRPWHREGNVQAALATYLAAQGYQLRQVVDIASRSTGVDIVAERDAQALWVTVKGCVFGVDMTEHRLRLEGMQGERRSPHSQLG